MFVKPVSDGVMANVMAKDDDSIKLGVSLHVEMKDEVKPIVVKNTGRSVTTSGLNTIWVIEIDGCEYLKSNGPDSTYTYTHKGNCKNLIHKENQK